MGMMCEDCRFWDDGGSGAAGWKLGHGMCRRNAPAVTRQWNTGVLWPLTKADDWCGEFEPIEDEEAKPDETLDADLGLPSDADYGYGKPDAL